MNPAFVAVLLLAVVIGSAAVFSGGFGQSVFHTGPSCREVNRPMFFFDDDLRQRLTTVIRPLIEANRALMDFSDEKEPRSHPKAAEENNAAIGFLLLAQIGSACKDSPDATVSSVVTVLAENMQHTLAVLNESKARREVLGVPSRLVVRHDSKIDGNALGNDTATLSAAQRGAIGDHVRECWTKDAGALDLEKQQVLLTVETDPTGIVRKADVAGDDLARMGDPRFRAFAGRVIRAVMDVRCANLPLPGNMLGRTNILTFRFSP